MTSPNTKTAILGIVCNESARNVIAVRGIQINGKLTM